jgi:hypothetical protein
MVLVADRDRTEVERSADVAHRLRLFSGCGHNQTFCPFDEWNAVFRRTSSLAKLPLFRPF